MKGVPSVGKEVIDLRSLGRWESFQNIFEVKKRIDIESLAGLNQAHDDSCSLPAFFGASREPIATGEYQRNNADLYHTLLPIDRSISTENITTLS